MPVERLSVSLSPELTKTIRAMASQMRMDVSRLIETLLRENPAVAVQIQAGRAAPNPLTKKGRPEEKLLLIGRASRAMWEERLRSGQVKFRGEKGSG